MDNYKRPMTLHECADDEYDTPEPVHEEYDIELLSEEVHKAWMEEKLKQGFHAPLNCPEEEIKFKFKESCGKCHTGLYPYSELTEGMKEYDRVMVRSVLNAINKLNK